MFFFRAIEESLKDLNQSGTGLARSSNNSNKTESLHCKSPISPPFHSQCQSNSSLSDSSCEQTESSSSGTQSVVTDHFLNEQQVLDKVLQLSLIEQ